MFGSIAKAPLVRWQEARHFWQCFRTTFLPPQNVISLTRAPDRPMSHRASSVAPIAQQYPRLARRPMLQHSIVTREEWLAARLELFADKKELTRRSAVGLSIFPREIYRISTVPNRHRPEDVKLPG